MTFIAREEAFTCEHCRASVGPLEKGTYRNHCPKCLWSKHVDDEGPGDRASRCHGMMRPAGIDQTGKKGFLVIHECESCGKRIVNKLAPDDEWTSALERLQ
jgi:DNA-directed RNA polymerase subunit RPC12/RpoP